MLKEFLERQLEKKKRFKEMEDTARMQKLLLEKQKSHDERELERFIEIKRQQDIKNHLKQFREKEKDDYWHKNMMTKKNMFKQKNPSIMQMKGQMLTSAY